MINYLPLSSFELNPCHLKSLIHQNAADVDVFETIKTQAPKVVKFPLNNPSFIKCGETKSLTECGQVLKKYRITENVKSGEIDVQEEMMKSLAINMFAMGILLSAGL